MTKYLLVDDNDGKQLDHIYASNLSEAEEYFFTKQRWTRGDILTLDEYHIEQQLSAYESQYM